MDSAEGLPESGLYPIRTVASLTGVNPITLRAWERRYGLLTPLRSDKGHRLYTHKDIDLINQVVELLHKGVPISQTKSYLNQQAPQEALEGPWPDYQRRMLNAVVRFDDQSLEGAYNEALSLHPIDMVTARLVVPLLQTLGKRWASRAGSIAEEHFFGAYMRNKLGARFHHEASRARGPRLVAACLPGEQHETGILLASLSVMARGYRVVLLGADTPLAELRDPCRRTEACGVLLSGSMIPTDEVLHRQLPALVQDVTVPVFIGGQTALQFNDAIVAAGAIPLGTDIPTALKRIEAELVTHSSAR
ncbi:hypothetical protein Tel_05980 [Candidatus Tenderia electrophaga]|jgi:DNA-binding transcriptional MerR regulator|uniref:MerR family transcriptional regulator n=1 Tax=Candidatus Tenderia electrophaga TaxID=1748243 RepID=A0A0S2TC44_9GAMM|nr:hypothetical protein Tel_05980 [Candidatus Tenderia electrophaga]